MLGLVFNVVVSIIVLVSEVLLAVEVRHRKFLTPVPTLLMPIEALGAFSVPVSAW